MEASRRTADPDPARRGPEAFAAEFIGTFVLVFFIALVFTVNSAGGLGFTDWAVIGLVHFLVLLMLVHTLGAVSGGYFNPAVTATLAALRKIAPVDAGIFIGLQLLGGLAGALVVKLLLDNEGEAVGYGQPEVSDAFLEGKLLPGFVAELIGTFVLMWAIMGVVADPRVRDWAGLAIGGTLGFAVMCIGPLTVAGLNPARAFGPSIVGDNSEAVGDFLVVYTLGPIVGALLAGMLYTAIMLQPGAGHPPAGPSSATADDPPGGEGRIITP